MEPRDLTGAVGPIARDQLGAYLTELGRGLSGRRQARQQILDEIADGLVCDVSHRVRAGLDPASAAARSIDEFGDARQLARMFNRVTADRAAVRAAKVLLLTGPIVGLGWLFANSAPYSGWAASVTQTLAAVPYLVIALITAVLCAGVVLAGRWPTRSHPVHGVLIAAACCLAVDTSMIASALASTDPAGAWPSLLAIGLSLGRIAAASATVGHLSRLSSAAR
jgi:hypothetical protein